MRLDADGLKNAPAGQARRSAITKKGLSMSFPAKLKKLFLILQKKDKFSSDLANKLCDIEFCKQNELQTEFPVLRPKGKSEFDDSGKYRRYYPYEKFNLKINDKEYIFTNNWFSKNVLSIQKFFNYFLKAEIIKEILEENHNDSNIANTRKTKVIKRKKNIRQWPKWQAPSSDKIKQIAKLLTPYLKFLHPEIITKISLSNSEITSYYHDYLTASGIDPKIYIWKNCSTMFPGIRRANGKTDNEYKKKQLPKHLRREKGAIYIDDNSYPKHIWAFIFTGQQFSNKGPDSYELAHIFEHKAVDRLRQEFINKGNPKYDFSIPLSGLFTSAAGLMYSPRTFVKITDHSLHARRLIQRKVVELYKDAANILPPSIELRTQAEEWDIDSFKWGDPVGDLNQIDQFLEYRKERIDKILNLEIPSK